LPVEKRDEANERERREREREAGGGRRGAGAEKGAEKTHFTLKKQCWWWWRVFFFFFKINFCKMAKLSPNKTFATKNINIYHGFG
jgi:hypothetical protein